MRASNDWLTTLRVPLRRPTRSWIPLATMLLLGPGLASLQTQSAHAQTSLAVDLDAARPWTIDDLGTGAGIGIRIGMPLETTTILLSPELGFSYTGFTKDGNQTHPPSVMRGVVGIRFGVGDTVRFGGMTHFGFGYARWPQHWYVNDYVSVTDAQGRERSGYQDLSHPCFTYDAGLFLEFSASSSVDIGLHVSYIRVTDDPKQIEPLDWLQVGLQASFIVL